MCYQRLVCSFINGSASEEVLHSDQCARRLNMVSEGQVACAKDLPGLTISSATSALAEKIHACSPALIHATNEPVWLPHLTFFLRSTTSSPFVSEHASFGLCPSTGWGFSARCEFFRHFCHVRLFLVLFTSSSAAPTVHHPRVWLAGNISLSW